jgi:soluble cytochrome b562
MDVEKTIAFLLEQQANFESQMGLLAQQQREASMRHEKEMADFRHGVAELRDEVRRAVHAGIEEQRRERRRRLELDERLIDRQ